MLSNDRTLGRIWSSQTTTGLPATMTRRRNHHMIRSREVPFTGASGWKCWRSAAATP